jgi:uncharacterized membrane protein YkvI
MNATLRYYLLTLVLLFVATGLAGCELIGDILRIGFWAGAIFVILVVLLIGWILRKLRGR